MKKLAASLLIAAFAASPAYAKKPIVIIEKKPIVIIEKIKAWLNPIVIIERR